VAATSASACSADRPITAASWSDSQTGHNPGTATSNITLALPGQPGVETEILTFTRPATAPTDPTEALNLLIKKTKCVGYGFRNFDNYRLHRGMLRCGVKWQTHQTARPRGPTPRLVA
jgi:hypothetical protein